MDVDALEGKIQTAQQCLAALLHRADELPLPQKKFWATLLEELFINLKELQGSIEQLHSENEELTYSYLALEAALKQCQMNYGSLVEVQGELVCRFQSLGILTFVNTTFANYFGKQPHELIGQNWIFMALETDQEALLKHLASLSRENSVGTTEHRVKLSNGEIRWQRWHHQALFNAGGEFIEFQSIGQDISSIHSACFRYQQAEKKTQPTNKRLPAVLDALPFELLRDIQSRLKTMDLLYQKLYLYQDSTKVNLADYIQDLANYLFFAYYQESNQVVLKLQIDQVHTGIKTAIICGQIITELLSNSLKHAFPKNKANEIFINLIYSSSGKLVLIVGDNGVGLPEAIDFNNAQSLGLRLVNSLIKEIQGYSEINGDNGTTFKISFNETV
ncbi:MAG: PAS domain S-box protein [Symploca sp. SIO2G7]|nr:PAS domain S-box protein [Symploca sp. SIO2G7]